MRSRVRPGVAAMLLLVSGLTGCSGSTPIAPSPTASTPPTTTTPPPPPPSPTRTAVTFRLRSGTEGLPPLAGATIYIDGHVAVTGRDGAATIDDVPVPATFHIDAGGFLSYRGVAARAANDLVLWPRPAGVPAEWVSLTSYYGPDYNDVLWRPRDDIELRLDGALADGAARATWEQAVREVSGAIESAGAGAPTIRLGSSASAIAVLASDTQPCQVVRWNMTPPLLTPPPTMPLSSPRAVQDPEYVLGIVTELVGFHLELARRLAPVRGGTLSPQERTAIRMRMWRAAGTAFGIDGVEDATGAIAEGTSGYFCR